MTWEVTVSGYNAERKLEAESYEVTGKVFPSISEHSYVLMYARNLFLRDFPEYKHDIKIEAKQL